MMQEYCQLLQISTSDEELRELSAAIAALPPDHPIACVLSRAKDFRQPGALADALLHPQDRAYTVPQLYAWLGDCGLSFGRWFEQAAYLPCCGILGRTPHFERLASLSEPSQHTAAELLRGTMTRHNFIAYRDDRIGDSQPIEFNDDRWRDYVPLRLPWTVCVTERVPPGCKAVLVNRAHTYPDLALPLDCAEEALVTAIDGKRSIAEIAQFTGLEDNGDGLAGFFKRLWQYDQVVFDLTRAAEPPSLSPHHSKLRG